MYHVLHQPKVLGFLTTKAKEYIKKARVSPQGTHESPDMLRLLPIVVYSWVSFESLMHQFHVTIL